MPRNPTNSKDEESGELSLSEIFDIEIPTETEPGHNQAHAEMMREKWRKAKEAAGGLRSFGTHMLIALQDISQLKKMYPVTWPTFMANSDASIFFGVDYETAKYISDRLGKITPQEAAPNPPNISEFSPSMSLLQDGSNHIPPPTRVYYDPKKGPGFFGTALDIMADVSYRTSLTEQAAAKARIELERAMVQAENARAKAEYDHKMKDAGRPRLTPEEIIELVGKGPNDRVARSMIVFGKADNVFNLQLAPFFMPEPRPLPGKVHGEALSRHKVGDRTYAVWLDGKNYQQTSDKAKEWDLAQSDPVNHKAPDDSECPRVVLHPRVGDPTSWPKDIEVINRWGSIFVNGIDTLLKDDWPGVPPIDKWLDGPVRGTLGPDGDYRRMWVQMFPFDVDAVKRYRDEKYEEWKNSPAPNVVPHPKSGWKSLFGIK